MSTIATRMTAQNQKTEPGNAQARTNPEVKGMPKPPGDDLASRIRMRAYEIYQMRRANGGAGSEMADWLQAEKEIKTPLQRHSRLGNSEFNFNSRSEILLASGG